MHSAEFSSLILCGIWRHNTNFKTWSKPGKLGFQFQSSVISSTAGHHPLGSCITYHTLCLHLSCFINVLYCWNSLGVNFSGLIFSCLISFTYWLSLDIPLLSNNNQPCHFLLIKFINDKGCTWCHPVTGHPMEHYPCVCVSARSNLLLLGVCLCFTSG